MYCFTTYTCYIRVIIITVFYIINGTIILIIPTLIVLLPKKEKSNYFNRVFIHMGHFKSCFNITKSKLIL